MKHQVRNLKPSCHSVWQIWRLRMPAACQGSAVCLQDIEAAHSAFARRLNTAGRGWAAGPPAKPHSIQCSPDVTQQAAPATCALSPHTHRAQPVSVGLTGPAAACASGVFPAGTAMLCALDVRAAGSARALAVHAANAAGV